MPILNLPTLGALPARPLILHLYRAQPVELAFLDRNGDVKPGRSLTARPGEPVPDAIGSDLCGGVSHPRFRKAMIAVEAGEALDVFRQPLRRIDSLPAPQRDRDSGDA